MAGRSIGAVYITVLANTKVFEREVKDALRKAGDASGKAYSESFNDKFKDIEKSKEFDKLAHDIAEDWHRIGRDSGVSWEEGFKDARISKAVDDEIKRIANRFHISDDKVAKNIVNRLAGAYAEVEHEAEASSRRAAAEAERALKEVQRAAEREAKEARQASVRADNEMDRALLRMADRVDNEVEASARMLARVVERNARAAEREAAKALAALERESKKTGRRVERDLGGGIFRAVRQLRLGLRRAGSGGVFAAITSILGAIIGLAAGASKVLIGIGEAIFDVGKFATGAATSVGSLGTKLAELTAKDVAIGIASGIGAALEAIGSAGVTAAISLAIVAAIIAVLIPVAGLLVAALSGVAGMLVIVGAALAPLLPLVLALGPVVLALGAAFGVILAAVVPVIGPLVKLNKILKETDPKKRAKDLKEWGKSVDALPPALQDAIALMVPFYDAIKRIGGQITEGFWSNFGDNLKQLKGPLKDAGDGLEKVAEHAGHAFANVLALLGDSESRQQFREFWARLAPLVGLVVDIGGQALLGLVGLFNAVAPSAQVLLANIDNLLRTFNQWISSTEGENKVKSWMDAAFVAAGHIWNTVKNLGNALAILFGPHGAKKDGDDFLTTIENLSDTFLNWIKRVSEDGSLKTWLQDAKDLASKVSHFFTTAYDTFVKLNTPANRQFLLDVIDAFTRMVRGLGKLIDLWNEKGSDVIEGLHSVWLWAVDIKDAFQDVWDKVNSVITKIRELANVVSSPIKRSSSWLSKAGNILINAGLASGGITTGPTLAGEAGPEAVIPLTGPLWAVDPSVRALSAMMRGQATTTAGAIQVGGGVSPTINVYPISSDPEAVAVAVFNRAVSAARV